MADYFLVKQVPGPAWDHSRRRREQAGWDEHAAFMDALTAEGVIVLGGPAGTGDGDYALLVMVAQDERENSPSSRRGSVGRHRADDRECRTVGGLAGRGAINRRLTTDEPMFGS